MLFTVKYKIFQGLAGHSSLKEKSKHADFKCMRCSRVAESVVRRGGTEDLPEALRVVANEFEEQRK